MDPYCVYPSIRQDSFAIYGVSKNTLSESLAHVSVTSSESLQELSDAAHQVFLVFKVVLSKSL
jgi:hypothetical protein